MPPMRLWKLKPWTWRNVNPKTGMQDWIMEVVEWAALGDCSAWSVGGIIARVLTTQVWTSSRSGRSVT